MPKGRRGNDPRGIHKPGSRILAILLTWGLAVTLAPTLCLADVLSPTELAQKTGSLYFAQSKSARRGFPQPTPSWPAFLATVTLKPNYTSPRGVFVTLSQSGKPRACWGSAYPQYKTVGEATVFATLGALTKEYRYPPIRPAEWSRLKVQVTVVKALQPVNRLGAINPLRDGLLVRQGGKAGIMLPGEATDATYMLVQAKLKAGIRPQETFQLYRIVADVYQ